MPMNEEMDDVRKGVLYVFSRVNCSGYLPTAVGSALDMTTAFVAFHGEQGNLAKHPSSGAFVKYAPSPKVKIGVGPIAMEMSQGNILVKLEKLVLECLHGVLDMIEKWRKSPPGDQSISTVVVNFARVTLIEDYRRILEKLARMALRALVPLFGSACELYDAITSLASSAKARFKLYLAGKGVPLREGVPKIAVSGVIAGLDQKNTMLFFRALTRAMAFALDVSVLFTGVAVSVVQSFVGFLATLTEEVIKLAVKMYEIVFTRRFIEEAKRYYLDVGKASSIHRDAARFDAWYRAGVERVPAIAAVTIRSRICGDKMRFLRMVDSTGTPMRQAEYDKAFAYLDEIGKQSGGLMGGHSVIIRSVDPLVDALLDPKTRTFNEAGDVDLQTRLDIKRAETSLASQRHASKR